jgi:undecaprenyl-diphosphatase
MSLLEAVVLGVLQGLTEFLPISSSGHLRIAPALLGWDDPGAAFTAVVQIGTMAAVLIYFRTDLWRIAGAWIRSLGPASRSAPPERDARLGWYLIVATIPISVFGLAFSDQIESGARDLRVVASALIVFGILLELADRRGTKTKSLIEVNHRDGVAIGLAQSLALIPGVSRSGATITAGLLAGYKRADAARFSFLLSIPAVVLSGLFQLRDLASGDAAGPGATVVATVAAFVVGYASIAWLLRWLTTHSTSVFVVYRLVLGTLLWVLIGWGSLSYR